MEGLVHWQLEFCPCKGWEGFKQKTGTIKFVIFEKFLFEDSSAKKGLRSQEAERPVKILLP